MSDLHVTFTDGFLSQLGDLNNEQQAQIKELLTMLALEVKRHYVPYRFDHTFT